MVLLKIVIFVFHCHENLKVISTDTNTDEVSKNGFQGELYQVEDLIF